MRTSGIPELVCQAVTRDFDSLKDARIALAY